MEEVSLNTPPSQFEEVCLHWTVVLEGGLEIE